jgi:hypothetical protein
MTLPFHSTTKLKVKNFEEPFIIELKIKLSRYTPWRRLGERRYRSYSLITTALDRGEWSASLPGCALSPGKGPPVPIVQEAGWAPEPVWTQRLEKKFFRLCRRSNPDRPVVQHSNIMLLSLWWREDKNSRNVANVCRKRRLKWVPSTWGYSWVILSPGVRNTEAWSSRLGIGRGVDSPTL